MSSTKARERRLIPPLDRDRGSIYNRQYLRVEISSNEVSLITFDGWDSSAFNEYKIISLKWLIREISRSIGNKIPFASNINLDHLK